MCFISLNRFVALRLISPMFAWYGVFWHAGSRLMTYGFIFCILPSCVKRSTNDVFPLPAIPNTIRQIGREFTSNNDFLFDSLFDDDDADDDVAASETSCGTSIFSTLSDAILPFYLKKNALQL